MILEVFSNLHNSTIHCFWLMVLHPGARLPAPHAPCPARGCAERKPRAPHTARRYAGGSRGALCLMRGPGQPGLALSLGIAVTVMWGFSDTHQPHSKRGSAFRHSPQLSRRAEHLYRWAATAGGERGQCSPTVLRCHWAPCPLQRRWGGWGCAGLISHPSPNPSLTLDVLGVVDDKVSIPDHG